MSNRAPLETPAPEAVSEGPPEASSPLTPQLIPPGTAPATKTRSIGELRAGHGEKEDKRLMRLDSGS